MVDEFVVFVEEEGVGCADCAVCFRDVLCFVEEVVFVSFFLSDFLHVFEAVFGMVGGVIAVDADDGDA